MTRKLFIYKCMTAIILCCLATTRTQAQNYMIKMKDGTCRYYSKSEVRDITLYGYSKDMPDVSPATAIDLGLSVKWASCNVGATKPEEKGGYYSWGETKESSYYDWTTYRFCDGTMDGITKYGVDGVWELKYIDDVAYQSWGGKWRIPTEDEITELKDRCTWERTKRNNVYGFNVTGPNGNSIFIPGSGQRSRDRLSNEGYGYYWSSSLTTPGFACCLVMIDEEEILIMNYANFIGLSVRPVQ